MRGGQYEVAGNIWQSLRDELLQRRGRKLREAESHLPGELQPLRPTSRTSQMLSATSLVAPSA
jgi:hypothetical protein